MQVDDFRVYIYIYMYGLYQNFEGYIQQYSPENNNFLSVADILSEAEGRRQKISRGQKFLVRGVILLDIARERFDITNIYSFQYVFFYTHRFFKFWRKNIWNFSKQKYTPSFFFFDFWFYFPKSELKKNCFRKKKQTKKKTKKREKKIL